MIPNGLFGSTAPYQSGDPSTGGYSMPAEAPDPHAKLKRIIGIIGDFAGGLAGGPPVYAQMEQKNHEEMLQAQREQQQLADQYAFYDYKQAHTSPDLSEFDKNAIAGGYTPGTPEWTTLHKNHADEMADPVVQTPNGMMLRSQAIAQMQGQPAPAGVTFTPITEGGPASQAPGGFP